MEHVVCKFRYRDLSGIDLDLVSQSAAFLSENSTTEALAALDEEDDRQWHCEASKAIEASAKLLIGRDGPQNLHH